jgi:hypothetical protein
MQKRSIRPAKRNRPTPFKSGRRELVKRALQVHAPDDRSEVSISQRRPDSDSQHSSLYASSIEEPSCGQAQITSPTSPDPKIEFDDDLPDAPGVPVATNVANPEAGSLLHPTTLFNSEIVCRIL